VETKEVSFCFNSKFHTAQKQKAWFVERKEHPASVLSSNQACQILKGILRFLRGSWSLFSSAFRAAFPCKMPGGLDGKVCRGFRLADLAVFLLDWVVGL